MHDPSRKRIICQQRFIEGIKIRLRFSGVSKHILSGVSRLILIKLSYNHGWVARDDHIGRHIFCNHGTRGNNTIVANGHSFQNSRAVTQPNIVTQMNGLGRAISVDAIVKPMPIRVGDITAVSHHAAVSQNHLVARGNSCARAHKASITNIDTPFTKISAPYANLDWVMHFTNGREGVPDANIGT